jgi:predicted CoA-binding protein
MKVRKAQIDSFLEKKKLAVAGVSRNEKKFGHVIFKELSKKGYEVLPINPNSDSIGNTPCYPDVESLPKDVDSILIATPKFNTDEILRSSINRGIKNIWVQQASNTKDTLSIAKEYDVEIIHDKCIFMFTEPIQGFHKFHRTINHIFGALPK